jgi:hypothetical protein
MNQWWWYSMAGFNALDTKVDPGVDVGTHPGAVVY